MMKKLLVASLISFIPALLFAQDTTIVRVLLSRIAAQQVRTDPFFMQGIFPSYISNKQKFNDKTKDNNIFYNALIVYTLKQLRDSLNIDEQLICDSIIERSRPLFTRFKNRKGRNTYNFWRTDSAYQFPYTNWIRRIKKNTALPDDMDDTVLSLMATDASDSVATAVHLLMQHYTNNGSVKTAISSFKKIPAYSTWFGKNFPVVYDVCVLTNVLSFVQHYQLEWTKADSAALQIIVTTLHENKHWQKPLEASPYYGKTSIILYHIARLMSIQPIPELETLKVKLVKDAVTAFATSNNYLEKALLASAINKLGYIPPTFELPSNEALFQATEKNNMPFFIGNIPSYFPGLLKKAFYKKDAGLFYHYCPAYNDVLLLEYLLLNKSQRLN